MKNNKCYIISLIFCVFALNAGLNCSYKIQDSGFEMTVFSIKTSNVIFIVFLRLLTEKILNCSIKNHNVKYALLIVVTDSAKNYKACKRSYLIY